MTVCRILLCIGSLGAGGAERQMLVLGRGLAVLPGVEVRLALIHGGGVLEAQAGDLPLEHLTASRVWHRRDVLPATWALLRLCRTFRPDVVYSFEPLMNQMALLAAKSCGARLFWGIRCSLGLTEEFSFWQRCTRALEARLSPLTNGIIANSEAGARDHMALGYAAQRMAVIVNGVDTTRFAPDAAAGLRVRQEFGLDGASAAEADGAEGREAGDAPAARPWLVNAPVPLVGLVARNTPMKDLPTFLRAASLLRRDVPEVRFLCVGQGFTCPDLHAQATALGLGEGIVWREFHADMPALYNALSVNVLSSRCEGMPNVLLEALACGVPSVCTDAGDSRQVVGDTGLVCPVGDAEALAVGLAALLREQVDHPEAWARRRRAARERAVAQFSTERFILATYARLSEMVRS